MAIEEAEGLHLGPLSSRDGQFLCWLLVVRLASRIVGWCWLGRQVRHVRFWIGKEEEGGGGG
jgi:hypothetical protein